MTEATSEAASFKAQNRQVNSWAQGQPEEIVHEPAELPAHFGVLGPGRGHDGRRVSPGAA